jgi:hypothetical protein
MSHKDQQAALEHELAKVVNRFRDEYDLTIADAIGVLEVVKLCLFKEQVDILDDDE